MKTQVKGVTPMRSMQIPLAHAAVSCGACFTDGTLSRAGIGMAQPFTLGSKYKAGGVAVVCINPGGGKSKDGGYKEKRMQALVRFAAHDYAEYFAYCDALEEDVAEFWNEKYAARLQRLGLSLDSLAVGNIALCATASASEKNKYPKWLLRGCFARHSSQMIDAMRPGVVILMGSAVEEFAEPLRKPGRHVIHMPHFAHRPNNGIDEEAECARVRAEMAVLS